MKILLILALCLGTISLSAQEVLKNFDDRLETDFSQKSSRTKLQQGFYINMDVVGILSPYLFAKEASELKEVQKKIKHTSNSLLLSEQEKVKRTRGLKIELQKIENKLAKKTGKKSLKLFLRGTQIFFIVDLGTRLYILNQLENSNPGFLPAVQIVSRAVSSDKEKESFLLDFERSAYEAISGPDANELQRQN